GLKAELRARLRESPRLFSSSWSCAESRCPQSRGRRSWTATTATDWISGCARLLWRPPPKISLRSPDLAPTANAPRFRCRHQGNRHRLRVQLSLTWLGEARIDGKVTLWSDVSRRDPGGRHRGDPDAVSLPRSQPRN